jgi:hypothetical protein
MVENLLKCVTCFGMTAAVCFSSLTSSSAQATAPENSNTLSQRVALLRAPEGGLQPQAVMDGRGVLHFIYLKGNPDESNIFYVRRLPGRTAFSKPVRVNSQTGSAIAVGTIRGPQIAVGRGNRVHISWNGSSKAMPKAPGNGSPMLYTRSNAAGTAFEPQRNLIRSTYDLDGGGTVAADGAGNVYVAWHAGVQKAGREANRRFWMAISTDEGRTFAAEKPVFKKPTGACGCCGTRAFVDRNGTVYALYRAATADVDRDMYLLTSRNRGLSFGGVNIHKWKLNACPMSSETFTEGPNSVFGAWETKEQVYFGRIDPRTLNMSPPISAPGSARHRKHPTVATNAKGETILAWTEGTSWARGGDLAWQVFDRNGKPTKDKGHVVGAIPKWGYATVVTRKDGGFALYY